MAEPIYEILAKFEHPKRAGDGYLVRCPAHEDSKASLSITGGADGRVLLKCHAGCHVDAVLSALNLTPAALFPARENGKGTIAVTYPYTDRFGQLLYETVRLEPKDFRQRRPDGAGGWIWNLKDVPLTLYRIAEWHQQAKTLVICEGEKDADAVVTRLAPFRATTSPLGAGKWRQVYTQQIVDAGVKYAVLCPDHDDSGRSHMDQVARALTAAGVKVKVLTLPGVPVKGDVSDWLNAGGTLEAWKALIAAAAVFDPAGTPSIAVPPPESTHGRNGHTPVDDVEKRRGKVYSIGELLARERHPVRWLVEDLIPVGALVLLSAKPKAGKSTLARALGRHVAVGEPFGDRAVRQGGVFYVATEGSEEDAATALEKLGLSEGVPFHFWRMGQPASGLEAMTWLREKVAILEQKPVLIIVDILQKFLLMGNTNDYAETSAAMARLETLKNELGVTMLVLHHNTKRVRESDDEDLGDAIGGSGAIRGSADSTLIIERYRHIRTLSTEHRMGAKPLDECVLEFNADTGRVRLGQTKASWDVEHIKDELLAVFKDSTPDGGLSQLQAFRHVKGPQNAKFSAFQQLKQDKSIAKAAKVGGRAVLWIATGEALTPAEREAAAATPVQTEIAYRPPFADPDSDVEKF